jgi:hypothetical protein
VWPRFRNALREAANVAFHSLPLWLLPAGGCVAQLAVAGLGRLERTMPVAFGATVAADLAFGAYWFWRAYHRDEP